MSKVSECRIWAWFPNMPLDVVNLVGGILASLPGGEQLMAEGFEPICMRFEHANMVAELLGVLDGPQEVREAVQLFLEREDSADSV